MPKAESGNAGQRTFPQKAGIEDDLRGLEADQKQLIFQDLSSIEKVNCLLRHAAQLCDLSPCGLDGGIPAAQGQLDALP